MRQNKKPNVSDKVKNHPDLTVNREGGVAFKPDMKTDLMLRTVSSMIGEDQFYASGKELKRELREAIHAVAGVDPAFILKLALYARTKMYLRTAPMVLIGEYGMSAGKGKVPNARKFVTATIQRADEIMEVIAYVIEQNTRRKAFKGKLPQVIKFGVADAFNKFDAYQFAKYNREGAVKLKDAMALCHPKPKDEGQEAIFKDIVEDTLAAPDTWEVVISTKGSTKENWESVIEMWIEVEN